MLKSKALYKIKYFVLFFSFFLINFCGTNYIVLTETSKEKGESLFIKDFKRQSLNDKGLKEWELKGGEVYIYQDESNNLPKINNQGHIIAYNFELAEYDKEQKSKLLISSNRGEFIPTSNQIFLEGNVHFVDLKNKNSKREIFTEKMNYNTQTEIVKSDVELTLKENRGITNCKKGIRLDLKNNNQTCFSPFLKSFNKK